MTVIGRGSNGTGGISGTSVLSRPLYHLPDMQNWNAARMGSWRGAPTRPLSLLCCAGHSPAFAAFCSDSCTSPLKASSPSSRAPPPLAVAELQHLEWKGSECFLPPHCLPLGISGVSASCNRGLPCHSISLLDALMEKLIGIGITTIAQPLLSTAPSHC